MNPRCWARRMETRPTERRRLLQDHRLHWQLRRCWDASPWYRARFKEAGIDPSSFLGLRDRGRLPLLTDAELQLATENHDTASLAVAPGRWWARTDADATRPARVLTDGDVIHQADLAARALWAAGARPDRVMVESAQPLDGPAAHAVAAGIARVRERPWRSYGGAPSPFTVQVGDIMDVRGVESPVLPSLRWTMTGDSCFALLGSGSGSMWNGPACALGNPYVAATLAYRCTEGMALHWADDHLLVEILDPVTHEPLPDGQAGAVVITELTREGTPLLRYWLGLAAALEADPCPCGRTTARSPVVWPLMGRSGAGLDGLG